MCPSGDRDYLDSVLFQLRVNIRPRGQALRREGQRVEEQQQPPVASGCGPSPAAESGHRSVATSAASLHLLRDVPSVITVKVAIIDREHPVIHEINAGAFGGHGQADAFPDHADRRVPGFQPPPARLVKHKTVQRRAFIACAHRIWARRLRSPCARLRAFGHFLGRIASAVPWMKALIFSTSSTLSLPVKSGMPRLMAGPLKTNLSRCSI